MLTSLIERLTTEEVDGVLAETHKWTFIKGLASSDPELVNLASLLDGSVLQLRKEVPLQLVVNMFQKMVSDLSRNCISWLNCSPEFATYSVLPSREANGISD